MKLQKIRRTSANDSIQLMAEPSFWVEGKPWGPNRAAPQNGSLTAPVTRQAGPVGTGNARPWGLGAQVLTPPGGQELCFGLEVQKETTACSQALQDLASMEGHSRKPGAQHRKWEGAAPRAEARHQPLVHRCVQRGFQRQRERGWVDQRPLLGDWLV